MIVLSEQHLRRILKSYFRYYHESRTHLSLSKDAPESRAIQANKLERIVQIHSSVDFTIATNAGRPKLV